MSRHSDENRRNSEDSFCLHWHVTCLYNYMFDDNMNTQKSGKQFLCNLTNYLGAYYLLKS
jgi:hypothetical protein